MHFWLIVRYIIAVLLVIAIILTPAWLAQRMEKPTLDKLIIRVASWAFFWTGIGWLLGLFLSLRSKNFG